MASKHDIDTDLALALEGNEDAEQFLKAVTAFIGYTKEVAKTSIGSNKYSKWTVQVKEASNLIKLKPDSNFSPVIIDEVYDKVKNGFDSLNMGIAPKGQSKEAIKHLKNLAKVAQSQKNVSVWIKRKPIEIVKNIAVNKINHNNKAGEGNGEYADYGSVEGILQSVSDYKMPEVLITDRITNDKIKCLLNKKLMKQALKLFGQRVGASGKIKYKADGTIVNINVEKFYTFPKPEEIPSFEDVIGIYKVQ